MIVLQHHHAIVHEHSYRLVHQQQKNPLHQQSRWWSGFFCRSWTCFLGPFLNKIVGQEPHLLVHEQLYGIVPELAFISRCWNPPNSLADYLLHSWSGDDFIFYPVASSFVRSQSVNSLITYQVKPGDNFIHNQALASFIIITLFPFKITYALLYRKCLFIQRQLVSIAPYRSRGCLRSAAHGAP